MTLPETEGRSSAASRDANNEGADNRLVAVLLDCGDTLVDEGTEVKNDRGATLVADLIPGAAEMVRALVAAGYPLGLVADGPQATFDNVLGHYGLMDLFRAHAISERVGVEKPHAAMFETALQGLSIDTSQFGRVVMVGNYLTRDIAGANALGLITVWLNWAPRRPKVPANALEIPDYEIASPVELLPLLAQIERNLAG
ncbi:MAG: HAD family hydrolase [Litorilinea sp.]